MPTIEKLKDKFYSDPVRADITTNEVIRLATHYHCVVKYGGNHQVRIANPQNGRVVPLPQHSKEVNRRYILELRALFDDKERK